VEFSNGFVVFNRLGNSVEVWRRYNDAIADENHERLSSPDQHQRSSHQRAWVKKRPAEGNDSEFERHRGELVPYATLRQLEQTRAYRFVYPTLLLTALSGKKAFLWDIPSASLIQTIDISDRRGSSTIPRQVEVNTINYVEQSRRHIFICTDDKLLVFTREPVEKGKSALVLAFPGENVDIKFATIRYKQNRVAEDLFMSYGREPAMLLTESSFVRNHVNFVAGKSPHSSRALFRFPFD
jgi:hypothetical protein